MSKVLILGPSGQYNHLILRRVKELGYEAELKSLINFDVNEEFFSIIIGGGPARLKKDSEELKVISKILNIGKPVLGICLGFQAISLAFGGELTKSEPSFGPINIIVKERDPILEGIPDRFIAWESHNDTVSKIPEKFKIIAESEKGYAEIIKHKEKIIYGVLFHPEVEHTQYGKKIIENFLSFDERKT